MSRKATRWPPHWEAGQRYDLAHVYPFKFDYTLPAREPLPECTVSIRVSFTSHVFTRSCAANEVPHAQYCAPREARRFDHERYELSMLLPDIVRHIGNRKCFFAKHDNFFVFELPRGIPDDSEYWVFFFLERADDASGKAVNLIVQSAYVGSRDRSPAGRSAKKISFRTLVSKTLAGETPKAPP
jgi:hypothetical protein